MSPNAVIAVIGCYAQLNPNMSIHLFISGSGRNKGIQVSVFDNGIEKSYSQLSTGERRFVDMSLLLTFSAFSPVDTILIDEALDSLSYENQLKVIRLLLLLNKQIFVVTHNDRLIESLSDHDRVSQLYVVKEEGVSEVGII